MPKDAPEAQVFGALDALRPGVRVVLLKRNMEDVVEHAAAVMNRPTFGAKPKPSERDAIVRSLALATASDRERFLGRMASFLAVVVAIEEVFDRSQSAPPIV